MPKLATRRAPVKAKKAAAKKTAAVKPIPAGYHTITPTLTVRNAAGAIEFYKKALGARQIGEAAVCEESGKIMHAELQVGDSIFFLGDEAPQMGCVSSPATLYLYVKDCDAAFKRAVGAGATAKHPVTDMFWGDRVGAVTDPFGHSWTFATHTKDLTDAQILEGQRAFAAQMKAKMQGGCSCGSKE